MLQGLQTKSFLIVSLLSEIPIQGFSFCWYFCVYLCIRSLHT